MAKRLHMTISRNLAVEVVGRLASTALLLFLTFQYPIAALIGLWIYYAITTITDIVHREQMKRLSE